MKRYIWVLCAALMAAACTDDAELQQPSAPEEEPLPAGVVEVPLTLTLGADWEVDAPQKRDVPPGQQPSLSVDGHAETENIDKVRVITFRRRNPDDIIVTSEADTAFIYDPSNDLTLDCKWEESSLTDHKHPHKVARDTLRKVYGYEYRVVALAYSSSRTFADTEGVAPAMGEENVFDFNLSDGLKFQDFKVTVKDYGVWDDFLTGSGTVTQAHSEKNLSRRIAFVPQFFFGYCHTEDGNPIIPFSEDGAIGTDGEPEQDIDKPLTGILYRGVAKLELNFRADLHEVAVVKDPLWCALLATNVNTAVSLTSYDDFLSPSLPITSGGGYTMIDRVVSLDKLTGDRLFKFTAYVLPGKMKLGIRIEYAAISEWEKIRSGRIVLSRGSESSAENATGIISTDVNGEEFYFRRNHKYVFDNPDEPDTCPLCYDLTEKYELK